MEAPSRSARTRLASTCDHVTGTGATRHPPRWARANASTSKPKPFVDSGEKTASAAAAVNPFIPHWVSRSSVSPSRRSRRL